MVLGPALDGGYWLVAQRQPGVAMFQGVPWSSPETLVATRSRLTELGVRYAELEPQRDVDTLEDLRAVVRDDGAPASLREQLAGIVRAAGLL